MNSFKESKKIPMSIVKNTPKEAKPEFKAKLQELQQDSSISSKLDPLIKKFQNFETNDEWIAINNESNSLSGELGQLLKRHAFGSIPVGDIASSPMSTTITSKARGLTLRTERDTVAISDSDIEKAGFSKGEFLAWLGFLKHRATEIIKAG